MKDLATAIENLYQTFGKYSTEGIFYCDCGCIDEKDVVKLNSKPLRQLELEDLTSYHGSALYTWGDIEHYKHYLPRILELYSQNRVNGTADLEEIFIKLDYAKWTKWPKEEQNAIKEYVNIDWIESINHENIEYGNVQLAAYGNFISIPELLKMWKVIQTENSLRNFVFFFYFEGNEILYNRFKILGEKYKPEFVKLIRTKGGL